MKNKGFTLIELLAVIIVLALIATIITTISITSLKGSKKRLNEIQEANIKEAAEMYFNDHVGEDNFFVGNSLVVSIETLVNNGYIVGSTKDVLSNYEYSLDASNVTITKAENNYIYKINMFYK